MNKHFLTEIQIKQFKCFANFKAEGFKRVNLIGGKNNAGKTAFMEACFVNVFSCDVKLMISAVPRQLPDRLATTILTDQLICKTRVNFNFLEFNRCLENVSLNVKRVYI